MNLCHAVDALRGGDNCAERLEFDLQDCAKLNGDLGESVSEGQGGFIAPGEPAFGEASQVAAGASDGALVRVTVLRKELHPEYGAFGKVIFVIH